MRLLLIALALACLTLTACGAGATSTPPFANPTVPSLPPTETPFIVILPSATFTPRPTETLIPSATPENQIFRDDFNGALQPGWTWENENKSRWNMTSDGWLQILGEDASLLGGQAQSNLLWRDLPEGNFAISVHLRAIPVANFQQATIYLYEDLQNYVAINRGYCGPCRPQGNGIYMEYKIGGAGGSYSSGVQETDLYLKLESKNNVLSGYFATQPDQWQRLGQFGNYFNFKHVGLGVTNVDDGRENADLAGLFDYFEITK